MTKKIKTKRWKYKFPKYENMSQAERYDFKEWLIANHLLRSEDTRYFYQKPYKWKKHYKEYKEEHEILQD